jgi:hypothetical protein
MCLVRPDAINRSSKNVPNRVCVGRPMFPGANPSVQRLWEIVVAKDSTRILETRWEHRTRFCNREMSKYNISWKRMWEGGGDDADVLAQYAAKRPRPSSEDQDKVYPDCL